MNGALWRPLDRTFPGFVEEQGGGKPQIVWSKALPHPGDVFLMASLFLEPQAMLHALSQRVAREVFDYLRPDGDRGLFGMILSGAGQTEKERVDVAGVFLEAVRRAVRAKGLRVNTNPGDLFVTPELLSMATEKCAHRGEAGRGFRSPSPVVSMPLYRTTVTPPPPAWSATGPGVPSFGSCCHEC